MGDDSCFASLPHFHAATPPGLTALIPYDLAAHKYQATTCFARSYSPASNWSSMISLFAISVNEDVSTIGMSESSSCVWRAESTGTAASLTVVQPMPAYR